MFEEIFFQALFVQTKLLFWKGKLYIRVCVCVCACIYKIIQCEYNQRNFLQFKNKVTYKLTSNYPNEQLLWLILEFISDVCGILLFLIMLNTKVNVHIIAKSIQIHSLAIIPFTFFQIERLIDIQVLFGLFFLKIYVFI